MRVNIWSRLPQIMLDPDATDRVPSGPLIVTNNSVQCELHGTHTFVVDQISWDTQTEQWVAYLSYDRIEGITHYVKIKETWG